MNNQIEEMAVIGCARTPQAHTAEECAKCDFKNGRCNAYRHAEALYNAGYRKIPKDSVVLSREEQERILTATEKRIKELKRQILQARKETAEKILKDFKLWAREYQNKDIIIDDNGERPMTNNEKLNYLYTYLCDKYEVEIKE